MRKTMFAAAFVAALALPSTAFAGPATDTVKAKQSNLFEVVAKPKNDARQKELKRLFDEMLAYDDMAKASLGKEWKERSSSEQTKFSGLLTRLVRSNYKRNLEKMLDYDIRYVAEESKDGTTTVKTRAKHKTKEREPELEIDFVIAKVDGGLKVVDIFTERASLVKTYRSQFLRILRKDGFDKLIEKMEKKLAKLEKS